VSEVPLSTGQARAVAIRLRLLEERLAAVRYLMEVDELGILYRRDRAAFGPDQRQAIDRLMAATRGEIAVLAELLDLQREEQDAVGTIVGTLAMSWQSLGDVRVAGLRGHGPVDPGLADLLDPPVERLMDLVLQMERVAAGDRRSSGRLSGEGRTARGV